MRAFLRALSFRMLALALILTLLAAPQALAAFSIFIAWVVVGKVTITFSDFTRATALTSSAG